MQPLWPEGPKLSVSHARDSETRVSSGAWEVFMYGRGGSRNEGAVPRARSLTAFERTLAQVAAAANSNTVKSSFFGRLGSFLGMARQKLMVARWAHTYLAPDSCGGERSGAASPHGSSRSKRRACQWRADPSGVSKIKLFWYVA